MTDCMLDAAQSRASIYGPNAMEAEAERKCRARKFALWPALCQPHWKRSGRAGFTQ